jgi:predicted O-methyltransferase YrrM
MNRSLRRIGMAVPPIRRLVEDRDRYRLESQVRDAQYGRWPPGHFYSPLPDLADVRARESEIFFDRTSVPAIDLRVEEQLRLISEIAPYSNPIQFPTERGTRFRFNYENGFFDYGDAALLTGMLGRFASKRVVEVGSGFSSALMLDYSEHCREGAMDLTFIEPYPDSMLRGLLRAEDAERCRVIEAPVQTVPLEVFAQLEANDLLFIDSSHVSRIGSDVNYLFFEVLPMLAVGVIVHIHDIFYPFEYIPEWVYEGRAWNEAYLLRAFLTFNDSYEIRLFSSYLYNHHRATVAAAMPLWPRNAGAGIYLQRTR